MAAKRCQASEGPQWRGERLVQASGHPARTLREEIWKRAHFLKGRPGPCLGLEPEGKPQVDASGLQGN